MLFVLDPQGDCLDRLRYSEDVARLGRYSSFDSPDVAFGQVIAQFYNIAIDSVCAVLLKNRHDRAVSVLTYDSSQERVHYGESNCSLFLRFVALPLRDRFAQLPVLTALFATMSLVGHPPRTSVVFWFSAPVTLSTSPTELFLSDRTQLGDGDLRFL